MLTGSFVVAWPCEMCCSVWCIGSTNNSKTRIIIYFFYSSSKALKWRPITRWPAFSRSMNTHLSRWGALAKSQTLYRPSTCRPFPFKNPPDLALARCAGPLTIRILEMMKHLSSKWMIKFTLKKEKYEPVKAPAISNYLPWILCKLEDYI